METASAIARQLLSGLGAAHDTGVLHLDFKSDNVMLRSDSETPHAVVMDFGLARGLDAQWTLHSSDLTRVVGSAAYIALLAGLAIPIAVWSLHADGPRQEEGSDPRPSSAAPRAHRLAAPRSTSRDAIAAYGAAPQNIRDGAWGPAQPHLERAVALDEFLGLLAWASPDPGEALAAARRSVELDPKYADGWQGVGDRQLELGEAARALVTSESEGDKHTNIARQLVDIYTEMGRRDQAARVAENYLKRKDAWIGSTAIDRALIVMCWALLRDGTLSPERFRSERDDWIRVHAVEHDEGAALEGYALGVETAAYHLGLALEQTGDATGACRAYAKVLARWGQATPRSITADAARARAAALGCSG